MGTRSTGSSGDDPAEMHELHGRHPRHRDRTDHGHPASCRVARVDGDVSRPRWPMIVLRSPKGWTGPKVVDGLLTEGTWRSHQVPLAEVRTNPEHLAQLESWLRSYRPERALRRRRRARPRPRRAAAQGRSAHEREPARERWAAARRAGVAGLSRLRRRGDGAGLELHRGDARARRLPPGRDQGEPAPVPTVRPR